MRRLGLLQLGGDQSSLRHHFGRWGGKESFSQQLPAAGWPRGHSPSATQRGHSRGGGLQPVDGHSIRLIHDLLASPDGKLVELLP